jgi:catechol 2,3-dioxygenase-like lactoylglutathione lyase family enzyme
MRVTRLDHANIQTPLFDESLRFYCEAIGLTAGPVPAVLATPQGEALRAAWLYDAGGFPIVHLIRHAMASGSAAMPAHLDHLALACEDMDGFAARLERLEVAFQRVSYPQYGIFQLVVHDPNGIKIELGFSSPVLQQPTSAA